jgi:membrane glycosyltransferase
MLFAVMMSLLLIPKFLSVLIHWRKRERLEVFGGGLKLAASALCETLASTLLAPNLALLQAKFVVGILMGRKVEWKTQDRGETSTTFREAFKRHWPSTLIGLVWTAALALTVPKLIWWFSPVIAGFILAIPLSAFSSRVSWGQCALRHGLFLTPEELEPPDLLRRFERELASQERQPWNVPGDGLARVLGDPIAWEVHLRFLPGMGGEKDPLHRNHLERLELKLRHNGPQSLTAKERRDLLLDLETLRALRNVPIQPSRAAC